MVTESEGAIIADYFQGKTPQRVHCELLDLGVCLASIGANGWERVVSAGLRDFVFLDSTRRAQDFLQSMRSVEFCFSRGNHFSASSRGALIRLYGRILERRVGLWGPHAAMRSAILHWQSGGVESALADLSRREEILAGVHGSNHPLDGNKALKIFKNLLKKLSTNPGPPTHKNPNNESDFSESDDTRNFQVFALLPAIDNIESLGVGSFCQGVFDLIFQDISDARNFQVPGWVWEERAKFGKIEKMIDFKYIPLASLLTSAETDPTNMKVLEQIVLREEDFETIWDAERLQLWFSLFWSDWALRSNFLCVALSTLILVRLPQADIDSELILDKLAGKFNYGNLHKFSEQARKWGNEGFISRWHRLVHS